MILCYGFRQGEEKQNRVCQRETAGKKERYIDAPAAENAANSRTKNKAQSESSANQSHSFRPIFFGRDIGDVRLRGRNIAAGNSIDDSADKKHPQGCRESQDQKSQRRAEQARQ